MNFAPRIHGERYFSQSTSPERVILIAASKSLDTKQRTLLFYSTLAVVTSEPLAIDTFANIVDEILASLLSIFEQLIADLISKLLAERTGLRSSIVSWKASIELILIADSWRRS